MTDYRLVPVEPTQEMVEAARQHHEGEAYLPVSLYKAMLAAAPAVQGEPIQRITMSYKQLIEAAYWANPDNDPDCADEEVCLFVVGERMGEDGEDLPAGLWLYIVECPEEGVIGPIDGEGIPQPAPDVAGLVAVLEDIERLYRRADPILADRAATALAAHRKQQEGQP